jgi:hypothetical protein
MSNNPTAILEKQRTDYLFMSTIYTNRFPFQEFESLGSLPFNKFESRSLSLPRIRELGLYPINRQ